MTPDVGAVEPSRGELYQLWPSPAEVDSMSPRELLSLAEPTDQTRVSLYLSGASGGPSSKRRIAWTNLIRAAAQQLRADGVPTVDVDRTLQPAIRAFDRDNSDVAREDSWVYFADTHWQRAMRVPLRVPRLAVAGDRCYIVPLVPLVAPKDEYFLLELRRDDIRLYAGTWVHLVRMSLQGLVLGPLASMPPRARPEWAFAADRSDGGSHGLVQGIEGGTEFDERRSVLEHFRRVDAGIRDLFRADEPPPLVLGGDAQLRMLYREVNSYPRLLESDIETGPHDLPPAQLHARCRAIVESALPHSQRQAVARFKLLKGTARTLTDLHDVLIAAEEGGVETLIIASDAAGAPESDAVMRLTGPMLSLDRAVVGTLRAGGDVSVERKGRMPGRTLVAAILRQ